MKTYVHDDSISLISSKNEKCFRKKSCRENENGHLTFQNYPPPPENHAVYERMWKNMVRSDSPQMTI
jgi:hypothetical protein